MMYEYAGEPTGIVGFSGIDQANRNTSWAFYSSPDSPKGIGRLMEFVALDYGFDVLGLHKLFCDVLAFNTPVIKLHEKFDFKVEGIFRDHYLRGNEFTDVYRLALLSREETRKKMAPKLKRIFSGCISK